MVKLWNRRSFLNLILSFAIPWIFSSAVFALEFPKVLFDSKMGSPVIRAPSCPDKTEKFFIHSKVNAEKIFDYGTMSVWVSDDAKKKCNVQSVDISNQLRIKSRGYENIVQSLSKLKTDAPEQLEKLQVKILVDDLSGSPSQIFRFYDRDDKIIFLDCRLIYQNYIYPSVAHEITHALLSEYNLEVWFEETLSQLMENEFGGWVPREGLIQLSGLQVLPSPFVTDGEFDDWRNYAMSYLFGHYLSQYFGGWDIFKGILENLKPIKTNSCQELRENLFATGQKYLQSVGASETDVDRFTLHGVLRYFAVATYVNSPAYSVFRIPGWQIPTESVIPNQNHFKIRAHQFLRLPLNSAIDKISPELEVYLIQKTGVGLKFIERPKKIQISQKAEEGFSQYLLVINPRDKELPLLK